MLYQMQVEGNLLQAAGNRLLTESPHEIMRNKKICETIGPIDNEVSRMDEAEVHIFSDSVSCMGEGASHMPDLRFTQMWKENLRNYQNVAMRINGTSIQFIFHMLPGATTDHAKYQ